MTEVVEEIEEEPEEENKEDLEDATKTFTEENVFYAGTRTSNN